MFEGIVASILNKYLSEYIDEVDYNNLKLGIFSGTIELLNVKIKPSALYQFDLPILVNRGIIGKLKINISWKNIMTKPTVAIVEDLFVLLGPFEEKINDPKRVEEIFAAHKRKRLAEMEKIDNAQIFENNKEKGFAERVQETIINNIQIYIRNVHIRYEDKHSLLNKNVSFGLHIKEFRAETTDADGKPNFLNAEQKLVYKIGSLKGFNVYWNISDNRDGLISCQPSFKTDKDKWIDILKESIDTGNILNVPFDTFIEKNLDLDIKLTLRRSYQKEDVKYPKIAIETSVGSIEFIFQRHQYKAILEIIDYYSMLNIHKKYVKYRPLELDGLSNTLILGSSNKDYKLWWKYAFTALAETTWRSYKPDRIHNHWDNYKIYWKKYEYKLQTEIKGKSLSDKDAKELTELEKILNLQSILDVRDELRKKYQPAEEAEKALVLAVEKDTDDRPKNYVEFRFTINLPLISLKLKNAGYEILQVSFNDIQSCFEIRPNADSIYFLLKTRGIDIEGVYYQDTNLKQGTNHQLVPIVKSKNNDKEDFLFSFCFETNPIEIENVEFSIVAKVSSLEIFYEKTTITEILRFFRTDLIDFEEVKKIRDVWSRAGLIYAVENHKQFHIKAELSSPYFIIPAKGTCLEESDSIVFFLGKTIIQSKVQDKRTNYTPVDIDDLEKNFYDKLSLDVNDVQVILIPSQVDWRSYLQTCQHNNNYNYHLLYPVSTKNLVYISINPNYKKLPKLKLEADCSSIKLNFSDQKIIRLADFAQKFPMPDMPKTSSPPAISQQQQQTPQSVQTQLTKLQKQKESRQKKLEQFTPEEDDEWDGPFNLPKNINGDPIPNYSQLILKFKIEDFTIDLNVAKSNKNESMYTNESEYLKLIFNKINIDFAITKFGMHFRSSLGDLKLIDHIHRTDSNNFTEILSSSSIKDEFIKFYFRQVDFETPNFAEVYKKILTNVLFNCSNIQLVCHRTAIIFFIKYAKGIVDNINFGSNADQTKASINETDNIASKDKRQISTVANENKTSTINNEICNFNLIAEMSELTWKMFDTKFSFGHMKVSVLTVNYNLKGIKTDLGVQLNTITINYDDNFLVIDPNIQSEKEKFYTIQEDMDPISSTSRDIVSKTLQDRSSIEMSALNTFYKQIITCTGDKKNKKFLTFNLVLFDNQHESNHYQSNNDQSNIEDNREKIILKVGKIKVICLVKFVNELIEFIDPIIQPLTEQVKEQAIEAVNIVKSAYEETKSDGKRIYLDIHVTSPQVIIPQNSNSFSGFLVDLGNLSITNEFKEVASSSNNQKNVIDEISLALENVEIKRIVYDRNSADMFNIREQVVEPITFKSKVKRTLTNFETTKIPDLDISLFLEGLKCMISLKSAKLLFAILDENLNEGLNKSKVEKDVIGSSRIELDTPLFKNSNINNKTNNTKELVTNQKKKTAEELKNNKQKENRVIMKLHVRLDKIKLMIVELKKVKETVKRENSLAHSLLESNSQSVIAAIPTAQSSGLVKNVKVNFSHLEIDEIFFNFIQNEFDSWALDLKIKDLNLKDLRPDSNLAVKDMFMPIAKNPYFFGMVYNFDPTESSLEFVLDHLKINLCLPYVLKLYQMAMEAISSTSNKNEKTVSETSKKKNQTKTNPNNNTTIAITNKESATNAVPMKVKGRVNLPEVVLFSEPEKTDSKILIMNAELNIKFQSFGESTSLDIDLVELAIRLGEYNNIQRHGIQFLSPCAASITMKQSNPLHPAQYKAIIESLYFNMTPTLYEVVMGVINTINKSGTEKIQTETEKKQRLEDSEPFNLYKVDKKKFQNDALNKSNDFEVEEEEINKDNELDGDDYDDDKLNNSNDNGKGLLDVLETLDLNINEAFITFCEESGIDLQPLAILKLELNGRVSNWTKNLHTKAAVTLEASYYNDRLSNWEPLIENVMQKEDIYRPWVLSLWFAMEPGCILQPPLESSHKGIDSLKFPVKDLDYSKLDDINKITDVMISSQFDSVTPVNNETQHDIEQDNKSINKNKNDNKNKESVQPSSHAALTATTQKQERDDLKIASYILIESQDILNINITPSAYKVIMYLAQITAGSDKEILENKVKPPLKFLNFLGEKCELSLSSHFNLKPEFAFDFDLKINDIQTNHKSVIKSEEENEFSDASLKIDKAAASSKDRIQKIITESQRSQIDTVYNENYKFEIQLKDFEKCKLSMKNDGSFMYQLKEIPKLDSDGVEIEQYKSSFEAIKYNMMYKVKTLYGRTKIIFSSPLQIENFCQIRLLIMVEIDNPKTMHLNLRSKFNILKEIKVVEKFEGINGSETKIRTFGVIFKLLPAKTYYVPLLVAYNCKIYTTPDNQMYLPSLIFDIRGYNLRLNDISEVNCAQRSNVNAQAHINQIDFQLLRQLTLNVRSHKNVMPTMHANYRVALYSPVKVYNSLPYPIRIDIGDQLIYPPSSIEPGQSLNIHLSLSQLSNCNIHVIDYLSTNWNGIIDWSKFKESNKKDGEKLDMNISPTTETFVSGKHLSISLSFKTPNEFTFYCPYWLVNKSGQQIKIRSTDAHRTFEIPDDTILLFDFKKISKKNKVEMSVNNGKWSSMFSLETVGTTGMIQCKDDKRTYNFLMRITMSNSSRTKLITFAPFLTIANQLDEEIQIREWHKYEKSSFNFEWNSIEPIKDASKPIAFWPNFAGESKQVCFVIKTSDNLETQPFPLENPGRFVLIAKQPTSLSSEANRLNQLVVTANKETVDLRNFNRQKILTIIISGGSQNPVTIVIRKYEYGDSVAKLINLCDDLDIFIKQKSSENVWKLGPCESMFFIWPELIKSTRELQWSAESAKAENFEPFSNYESLKLTKSGKDHRSFHVQNLDPNNASDDSPNMAVNENDTHNLITKNAKFFVSNANPDKEVLISCVSYIDDSQRTILFTKDDSLAEIERSKESSSLEIYVSLRGIQISLINTLNLELASICIKDSKATWDLRTNNETKVFTSEYCEWLERQYCNYMLNLDQKLSSFKPQLKINNPEFKDSKFEVNFKKMTVVRPDIGTLQRNWQPGLYIQYRTSPTMMSLKSCIYKIQIDNQLPDAYFPICFYKAPVISKEIKDVPFLVLSLFTELQEVTQIYRYFDFLLQEFYLKVDKGFIFSLKDWYDAAIDTSKIETTFEVSEVESQEPSNLLLIVDKDKILSEKVEMDLKLTKEIMEYANQYGGVKQSAHIRFDDFNLSQITFNLSFSVNGTAHTDDKHQSTASDTIFNFFLESIGATITEFKDVKFRFRQFDMNNQTKTWKELYDELFDHYKIQVLHQAYVLILGLDVLGNPFGLVSDFSQGLTDLFYDPLLGYFSHSNDIEKIDINMKDKITTTVVRTISSAAGSGSLIAGSIGRVLATCTFDKEYKRKRQYKLSKSSTMTFQDTMTLAGKGIVSGLVYGVTGIIRKPLEESKDGPKGVFKGLGKGCLGLFTKPIGSIFDGISQSLDGLKRFSQSGSELIINIRLPRHLLEQVAILPYSEYQAKGYEILRDLQNDDIALDELYWAHIFIESKIKTNKNSKFLLFITDRHIFKLRKTHTQILKKWHLIENAVPLHKVIKTTIKSINTPERNESNTGNITTGMNIFKKNTSVALSNSSLSKANKDIDVLNLYVTCREIQRNKDDRETSERLLLASDLSTVSWINDKINSAIKYFKELKTSSMGN